MAPPDLELPPLWAGCRICQQVQDDEFRSLAQLQWALTQQPGLHEAVAAEGGLCNHHMWYLSGLATDALVARLVGAIVRTALDRIGGDGVPGPGTRRVAARPADCRVCRFLHDREAGYLQSFIERVRADGGEESEEQLCLPHLMRASALCDLTALRVRRFRLREIADQFLAESRDTRPRIRAHAAVLLSHGRRGMSDKPSAHREPCR